MYPLTRAAAYRAAPGRSTIVVALGTAITPLELGIPLCLGWVADSFGLSITLVLLLLQPLAVFLVAGIARDRDGVELNSA